MPNLPLLSAPDNIASATLPGGARPAQLRAATVSPTLTQPVRANTDMYAGEAAAGRAIGSGIEEAGDLAFRIKNAQDAAFITRSQTAMEGESLAFQSWTKQNPDPSTWEPELQERIAKVKDGIGESSSSLSPLAKQRLDLVTNQWETRTTRGMQLQATEQSLSNAQADSNEYISLATTNNDLPAIQQKLEDDVKAGIRRPIVAQHILQKSRTQILTNTVNGMIDNDPFTTEKVLGDDTSFPSMNATLKESLKLRAHRAAEQTRTNTMKGMAQGVFAMQNGTGPDVDKDELLATAEHQGINPKYVEKLFKPAKTFDAEGAAGARVAISTYDPVADEQSGYMKGAELQKQIYGLALPPQATTELLDELKKKQNPKDPLNSPVARTVLAQMKADREQNGVFIPTGSATKDVGGFAGFGTHKQTEATHVDGGLKALEAMDDAAVASKFGAGVSKRAVVAAEQVHFASQLAKMNAWIEEHPKATAEEAENYRQTLTAPYVMAAVAKSLNAAPQEPAKIMTETDVAAVDWAESHPDDPRAKKILDRWK